MPTFIDNQLDTLHDMHHNFRIPEMYYIRDILAYGIILQQIEEQQGRNLIPVDKWVMGISALTFDQVRASLAQVAMAGYFAVFDFDKNKFSLNDNAKKEILEAFNSDKHSYKLDTNLPGTTVSGQQFSLRMNNHFQTSTLPYDDLASLIATSIKSILPAIQIHGLHSPHPDISLVRISYDDLWESGIIAVRNPETLKREDFLQAAFFANPIANNPYLMIYPSMDRGNTHLIDEHAPRLYGLSDLSCIRFLHLLNNLAQETKQADKLAQHFPAFFDLRDPDAPNDDTKRVRHKYEYSPKHGIQMLKKTLN